MPAFRYAQLQSKNCFINAIIGYFERLCIQDYNVATHSSVDRLRLTFCSPRFESNVQHLRFAFVNLKIDLCCQKDEINIYFYNLIVEITYSSMIPMSFL